LLGLAYKKNIDDVRESPAVAIRALLEEKKFNLRVWDPYLPKLSTVSSLEEALANGAAIMLATDHDDITAHLTARTLQAGRNNLLVDGKNALDGEALARAGVSYYGIGRRYLPA